MSARRRRSQFAAPLVVTLAIAPACIIRTGSGSGAPPPGPRVTGDDHRGDTPPTPISNPPRPAPDTVDSTPPGGRPPHASSPGTATTADPGPTQTPPPRQTDGSTDVVQGPQPTELRYWTVHQRADKGCYAVHDTSCPPPPSTCNPPAPARMKACPDGITPKTPVKVQELSPDECYVMHAAPACPAGVSCNPPRPTKIECPAY